MSKYIDVDVFIKSFREALPGLKAQVDPDLTPKAYVYLRGGEAIIEDLTKFPAADVAPVVHAKWDANGRCTNCGGHAPFYSMASTYHESPYCFECGAKMDGEGV